MSDIITNIVRYETLLGCGKINLGNTSELYARFTKSMICNAIVQNSIDDCSLTGDATRPLCADSCVRQSPSSPPSRTTNFSRPTSPRVKPILWLTARSAIILVTTAKPRSELISPTARCPTIHFQVLVALRPSPTNRKTVGMGQAPLVFALTANQAASTLLIRVATLPMLRANVPT